MRPEKLTLKEARTLTLSNLLLLNSHRSESKNDLLKIIEKLGYVQIDTISIVERAHNHILWTRFPDYKNEILDKLIDKDKKVFEFWDHAAAYMPMSHYCYTLPRKEFYKKKFNVWGKKNRKLLKYIKDRITEEGPLQSRDFDDPKKRGLWWDWKPAKEGLEYLFLTGVLSAKARKNFQKVYDLTERVIPDTAEKGFPTEEEQSRHLITKTINSHGFASEKEITYLRHRNSKSTGKLLNELVEERFIIPLEIEGLGSESYYTFADNLKNHRKIKVPDSLHILSPFDNLVIQRKRLSKLFGFDYVIECYVPAHKRKYGYFCLPVLDGIRFIGRLDAKADRKTGILHVIKFFPETGAVIDNTVRKKVGEKLQELAEFSGCTSVDLKFG
jgi:uncharacterized protein